MLAYGYIKNNWQRGGRSYTRRQCSIGVNAKDLATMAGTLANGGKNPSNRQTSNRCRESSWSPCSNGDCRSVRRFRQVACLQQDLPAKSGVGGGLIAVSPGKFGIAVISPPLDDAGNSVSAQKAITDISNALGGNPYSAKAR